MIRQNRQPPLISGKRPLMCDLGIPKSYCDHWIKSKSKKPVECRCGEEDCPELDWTWESWENIATKVLPDNIVKFHPVYSQGTAIVRGAALKLRHHHYWEIKMTSTVSGTDMMVGIGTEKLDLLAHKYRFVSALGLDGESYGFSYRGIVQYQGQCRYYGHKFGAGSIVGVHLDLFRGTLEFYLNRIPLGIAFRNLPVDGSRTYYPMVSSTAAKTATKLLNATSFPESLQYQAMRCISRYPALIEQLQKYPEGFRHNAKLWYLQRTEKFNYHQEPKRFPEDVDIFEQSSVLEDDPRPVTSEDIYGSLDEDVARLNQHQCHPSRSIAMPMNDSESPSSEDEDAEMVLFSYFCDHFS